MVACSIAVFLVWPLINTMALRNLLLFTGGSIGAWYLIQERHNLYQKSALPLLMIFLLFAWMGIHYFLFAQNAALELEQMKGVGLRALLGVLLGISTGLFARHHQRAQYLIWLGFSSVVIIFFLNYAWVSFTTESNWTIPYPWAKGFYGNKISIAFFGIVALALSCGVISYELMQNMKNGGRIILASTFWIGLTLLAFIFVGTKNGVAVGLFLIFSLFAVYFVKANKSLRTNIIASIFVIIIGLLSFLHLKLNKEWHNFLPTVVAGIQIDKNLNWLYYCQPHGGAPVGLPVLEDGSVAPESAYLRAAYATKGAQLLFENPLGYGLVEPSFMYLVKESYSFFSNICSLSGWLDFALGVGIPGLLLIWASIASAIYYSYKQNSRWSYCSRWMLAGAFVVWIVAEVSRNHFVEALFFLIALLSAGNLPVRTNK